MILGYIEGRSAAQLAKEVGADRSTVTRWIAAYAIVGFESLRLRHSPGRPPKLNQAQMQELERRIEEGPPAAGFYGSIGLNDASFTYAFTSIFNGSTFLDFLKRLVEQYTERKVFLITDNAPYHNLNAEGQACLHEHQSSSWSRSSCPRRGVAVVVVVAVSRSSSWSRASHQNPSLIEAYVLRFR